MPSAECSSPGCRAPIDWATKWPEELNDKGLPKTVPVDHDSVDEPDGKLEVWSEPVIPVTGGPPVTVLRFRYLKKDEEVRPGCHRGRSHWGTCKDAETFRSRKRAAS